MDFRESWEAQAERWIKWARTPGHDSYWRYHRDQFIRLLPPPGKQTVDVGCGEGRLTRHLKELGHVVVGIDASPSLVAAAREADPSMDILLADATSIPLEDKCADLAVAFMSLHDIDAMPTTVKEVARILVPGGHLCLAIEEAGLFVEALREPSVPDQSIGSPAGRRWQRLPLFLHVRACRP